MFFLSLLRWMELSFVSVPSATVMTGKSVIVQVCSLLRFLYRHSQFKRAVFLKGATVDYCQLESEQVRKNHLCVSFKCYLVHAMARHSVFLKFPLLVMSGPDRSISILLILHQRTGEDSNMLSRFRVDTHEELRSIRAKPETTAMQCIVTISMQTDDLRIQKY